MKRFSSWALSLLVVAGSLSGLASCNSARYYQFTTHSSAYHPAVARVAAPVPATGVTAAAAVADVAVPALSAATAPALPVGAVEPGATVTAGPATPPLSSRLETARADQQLTRAQERRYERVLKRVKSLEATQPAAARELDVVALILAIFIPPLGVIVHEKTLNAKFWISLLLTLLFFFPGMIYAILVVTDTI